MLQQKFLISLNLLLVCLTLTACAGKSSSTATVTLVSGIESQNRHFNWMAALHDHAQDFAKAGEAGCGQSQVLSGFGVKTASGDSSSVLSTYPVSLNTPYTSTTAVTDYSGGAAGWLAASTLATISLPAPTNVKLDFGILGALTYGLSGSDGTCLTESGSSILPSYSLIGHTSATVTSDTTLPIRLWVNKAAANTGDLPAAPSAACSSNTDNDGLTQVCPSLNFNQVKIACPSGSSCAAGTNYKLRAEYFYAINGSQHITQLVNLSDATGTTATKLLLPDIQPLVLTILDSNNTVIESAKINNNNSNNNSTFFFTTASGTIDTAYATSTSNSGFAPTPTPVSSPSPFSLATLTQDPNSSNLLLSWSMSSSSSTYDVEISSDNSTYTALPSLTNLNQGTMNATVAMGTSPNGYTVGSLNYLRVRAKNGSATTLSSNTLSIIPVAKSGVAPSLTAGSTGQINVLWSTAIAGANTYLVHYGPTSSVAAYPSGYSAGITITPGTNYTATSLSSSISYSFVIEGKNSSGGSTVSAVAVLTAP